MRNLAMGAEQAEPVSQVGDASVLVGRAQLLFDWLSQSKW